MGVDIGAVAEPPQCVLLGEKRAAANKNCLKGSFQKSGARLRGSQNNREYGVLYIVGLRVSGKYQIVRPVLALCSFCIPG